MSIEVEAFDAVRAEAYREWRRLTRAQRSERADEIRDWCEERFRVWRDGRPDGADLSDAQIHASVAGIVGFLVHRFAEPPAPAKSKVRRSTADSRAYQTKMLLDVAPDMLIEDGEKATISLVAARAGVSRSRVVRARQQGQQTPGRERIASSLSLNARKLMSCLDQVVPGDGIRTITAHEIAAAIWPVPTTDAGRRQQRRRMLALLNELKKVGYHYGADRELVVLRRGRRFRDDEIARSAEAVRSGRSRPYGVPQWRAPGFWTTTIVKALVAALDVAITMDPTSEAMCDWLALPGDLLDWRPIYSLMMWWHQHAFEEYLPEFLQIIAARKSRKHAWSPRFESAVWSIGCRLEYLYDSVGRGWAACYVIDDDLAKGGVKQRLDADDLSRVKRFLEVLGCDRPIEQLPDIYEALDLCRELAAIEDQGGDWEARLAERYPPPTPVETPTPVSSARKLPVLPPDPDCPF